MPQPDLLTRHNLGIPESQALVAEDQPVARCGFMAGDQADVVQVGHPELARQAIITAFLYKNQGRWDDVDQSLDQLAEGEEDDEGDEMDSTAASDDFTQLFDQEGGDRE